MADTLSIATALIKHCEGVRLAPYLDLDGKWTIGYGAQACLNGLPVTATTQPVQMYQADMMLRETLLVHTQPTIQRLVTVPLNNNQTGALCSFVYNVGGGAFAGSTMLRLLNEGQTAEATDQFSRWIFAGGRPVAGLVARRALEQAVFDGTVDAMTFPLPMVPAAPHPVFTSDKTTLLSPKHLNIVELACLRLEDLIPEALR